jgi:integrase/recombinase XerD
MTRMPWEITSEMFLSMGEIDALLAHVRSAAVGGASGEVSAVAGLDRVIIETLLFSGIRNSELCRLVLGDLVMKASRCLLRVQGVGAESRDVFIPSRLAGLLREYISSIRREMLPAGVKASDPASPLFFNERGKAYERTGLYRRVIRILTEAGLGDRASVQLLRHTYGFVAYKQTGGNLLFVQRQLGHAHPMITSVYARLVEERYEDLAEKICPEAKGKPTSSRSRK